jgi:cob(I)alamin adenosyltransferase
MSEGTVPVSRDVLDTIQQRLFAVVLHLHSLRAGEDDDAVARKLEYLEIEVDGLIREVRSHASAHPGEPPSQR